MGYDPKRPARFVFSTPISPLRTYFEVKPEKALARQALICANVIMSVTGSCLNFYVDPGIRSDTAKPDKWTAHQVRVGTAGNLAKQKNRIPKTLPITKRSNMELLGGFCFRADYKNGG